MIGKSSEGSAAHSAELPRVRDQLALDLYLTSVRPRALTSERLGTFQDNLRAPIHRWFKYPAGFSYKLVQTLIEDHGLTDRHWILDPFVGCGTTLVAAGQCGVNAVGLEAHPFVAWVAGVKTCWNHDMDALYAEMQRLLSRVGAPELLASQGAPTYPELVHKCYSPENLRKLAFIQTCIRQLDCSEAARDVFLLALTDTLRSASKAGTGWPYIAPSKYHEKQERDAIPVFASTVKSMFKDLLLVRAKHLAAPVETRLLHMDARDAYPLEDETIDMAVTSPPYLNNYDYADRTRLEMYFMGWAATWRDITTKVRDRLIYAATTQIRRTEFAEQPLSSDLLAADSLVYHQLRDRVGQLERARHTKGGKKSYDLMVAGYFNDLLRVLKQVCRVVKRGGEFVVVLGDSAPYGVHIPTEEYLGRLGLGVGFSSYAVHELRIRGGKWGHNTQRHKVMLKESLLILTR